MQHDLVRAFKDLMDSEISEEALDWVVLQIAVPTVHLEAIIHDIEALVCGEFLGHGAVHRVVRVSCFDQLCTMPHHEARSFEVSGHSSELELHVLVGRDRLAKLLPSLDVVRRSFDACSSASKTATRDVKTTTIESRESNLESLSLLA